jgi:hypothetical protein
MSNYRLRGAAYRAYVRDRVGEYMKTMCPAFTLKELAKFAKLSVSPSLRRRVGEMSKDGLLIKQRVFVGQRGSQIIYYKQNTKRMDV